MRLNMLLRSALVVFLVLFQCSLQSSFALSVKNRAQPEKAFPFPKIIHAAAKDLHSFPYSAQWSELNPGWTVQRSTNADVDAYLQTHYPDLLMSLQSSTYSRAEYCDVWRTALLYEEGGVYFDSDVLEIVPIERWLPQFKYSEDVDLVVGTEFPRRAGPNPVQFETWALLAKPHNPILKRAIELLKENLHLDRSSFPGDHGMQVIQRTGNGMWTKALLDGIRSGGGVLPPLSELNEGRGHLLKLLEPDGSQIKVVLLPYRAFGFNEFHGADVVKVPSTDHLVEHQFFGSWK